MKGLIDEGKWDEAFQAVVAYTLQVDMVLAHVHACTSRVHACRALLVD